MNSSDQDRLLREILNDDSADFRRASLENSLAALRRRRWQRRAAGVGLAAIAMVTGVLLLLPNSRRESGISIARVNRPPAEDSAPPIKVLNDDELLALFPNRSVGLIGNPGHQTLVFFDQPAEQ